MSNEFSFGVFVVDEATSPGITDNSRFQMDSLPRPLRHLLFPRSLSPVRRMN